MRQAVEGLLGGIVLAGCITALALPEAMWSRSRVEARTAQEDFSLPNPQLTPGSVSSASLAEICAPSPTGEPGSYYSRQYRHTTLALKARVAALYSYRNYTTRDVEYDHLVPVCLGGADDAANIWPQPRSGHWTAAMKDRLEAVVCRQLCQGHSLTLQAAQALFAPDWRRSYCRLVEHAETCDTLK